MVKKSEFDTREPLDDEPPPFLTSWPRVYVAVICYAFLIMTLLLVFSRAFAF